MTSPLRISSITNMSKTAAKQILRDAKRIVELTSGWADQFDGFERHLAANNIALGIIERVQRSRPGRRR
jgi:hypothetical protein